MTLLRAAPSRGLVPQEGGATAACWVHGSRRERGVCMTGAGVPKLPYTRWVPSGVGSHSLPGTEVPDTTGYQELVQVSWIRLGTRQSPVEGPVETLPFVPPPVSEGHQLPPAHLLLQ